MLRTITVCTLFFFSCSHHSAKYPGAISIDSIAKLKSLYTSEHAARFTQIETLFRLAGSYEKNIQKYSDAGWKTISDVTIKANDTLETYFTFDTAKKLRIIEEFVRNDYDKGYVIEANIRNDSIFLLKYYVPVREYYSPNGNSRTVDDVADVYYLNDTIINIGASAYTDKLNKKKKQFEVSLIQYFYTTKIKSVD